MGSLFGTRRPTTAAVTSSSGSAYRIQELTFGGLRPTRRMLDPLADEVEGKKFGRKVISDPRNPVIGTRLVREWNGAEHVITVLKDGFDWQGRRYKSLSAIARDITGTQWNGYRFFGLRERRRRDEHDPETSPSGGACAAPSTPASRSPRARHGVQQPRCPARGLRGLCRQPARRRLGLLREPYDDGGFSGGTLERPAPEAASSRISKRDSST